MEGPTDDPEVEALRNRQVKNFFALELLAAGTPMLVMGDEVRRTQQGNNNAYCQDNEISWFDWSLLERHADIHRFVKLLNEFHQRRDVVTEKGRLSLNQLLQTGQDRLARGEAQRPGLERAVARSRLHAAQPARPLSPPRDAQCPLGAVDVRAAPRPRGKSAALAALYRHRAGVTRRHLPLGAGAVGGGGNLRGAAALDGPSRVSAANDRRRRFTSEVIPWRSVLWPATGSEGSSHRRREAEKGIRHAPSHPADVRL